MNNLGAPPIGWKFFIILWVCSFGAAGMTILLLWLCGVDIHE